MTMQHLILLLAFATTATALQLSEDNYESVTAGKYIFVKLYAHW